MDRENHQLFQPMTLGALKLSNRIVMAPLTRSRASIGDAPSELNATYYAQRASAGLIISEATQISPQGKGYAFTPGIYSEQQVSGWNGVTDAVHAHGGKIFAQLWHVGRISHPDLQPLGALPVAPSAIKPIGQAFTETGLKPFVMPRALELHEIKEVIAQYTHAAQCAKRAGFDGVEIHAANGYLLDQFMRDKTNQRTDQYGGSIDNRLRLTLEVVDAVHAIWGARVGIRLSPVNSANDINDTHPFETFSSLIKQLNRYELAYIHCVEGATRSEIGDAQAFDFVALRKLFHGYYMANNGYDFTRASLALDENHADLIAFGRPFIGNPDLVQRLRLGALCQDAPHDVYYGGGATGYTDWPTMDFDKRA